MLNCNGPVQTTRKRSLERNNHVAKYESRSKSKNIQCTSPPFVQPHTPNLVNIPTHYNIQLLKKYIKDHDFILRYTITYKYGQRTTKEHRSNTYSTINK